MKNLIRVLAALSVCIVFEVRSLSAATAKSQTTEMATALNSVASEAPLCPANPSGGNYRFVSQEVVFSYTAASGVTATLSQTAIARVKSQTWIGGKISLLQSMPPTNYIFEAPFVCMVDASGNCPVQPLAELSNLGTPQPNAFARVDRITPDGKIFGTRMTLGSTGFSIPFMATKNSNGGWSVTDFNIQQLFKLQANPLRAEIASVSGDGKWVGFVWNMAVNNSGAGSIGIYNRTTGVATILFSETPPTNYTAGYLSLVTSSGIGAIGLPTGTNGTINNSLTNFNSPGSSLVDLGSIYNRMVGNDAGVVVAEPGPSVASNGVRSLNLAIYDRSRGAHLVAYPAPATGTVWIRSEGVMRDDSVAFGRYPALRSYPSYVNYVGTNSNKYETYLLDPSYNASNALLLDSIVALPSGRDLYLLGQKLVGFDSILAGYDEYQERTVAGVTFHSKKGSGTLLLTACSQPTIAQ